MARLQRNANTILISAFLVFFFFFFVYSAVADHDLRITNAERRIDLTSHIVKVFLTLKVENRGSSPASEVVLAFPPNQVDNQALLKAAVEVGKKKKKTYISLDVNPKIPDGPSGAKYFAVLLVNPLKTNDAVTLEIVYILTQSLEPFPSEISQQESQLVYYHDSATILSPYHIEQQATLIRTPTTRVESFTNVKPAKRAGHELTYGPYADQAPFSFSPIVVHFENNNPFAVVEDLVREIEISHWGSVQVRDHYNLVHGGARLKGVFSRVEYQQSRSGAGGVSSFKRLLARLPPKVNSVYYRDNIGNISSSNLRVNSRKSELEIEPRYPLFGGWRATFVVGYKLPLEDFLFESSDGRRYLNFTFGCPILETVVDKLTIKVALPEGSTDPTAVVPFSVDQHLETTYSYLDIMGRTVVVLEKRNVVPEHNSPFQVYYRFNPVFMLAEPLMLISVFLLFFLSCIVYLHGDISIQKFKSS